MSIISKRRAYEEILNYYLEEGIEFVLLSQALKEVFADINVMTGTNNSYINEHIDFIAALEVYGVPFLVKHREIEYYKAFPQATAEFFGRMIKSTGINKNDVFFYIAQHMSYIEALSENRNIIARGSDDKLVVFLISEFLMQSYCGVPIINTDSEVYKNIMAITLSIAEKFGYCKINYNPSEEERLSVYDTLQILYKYIQINPQSFSSDDVKDFMAELMHTLVYEEDFEQSEIYKNFVSQVGDFPLTVEYSYALMREYLSTLDILEFTLHFHVYGSEVWEDLAREYVKNGRNFSGITITSPINVPSNQIKDDKWIAPCLAILFIVMVVLIGIAVSSSSSNDYTYTTTEYTTATNEFSPSNVSYETKDGQINLQIEGIYYSGNYITIEYAIINGFSYPVTNVRINNLVITNPSGTIVEASIDGSTDVLYYGGVGHYKSTITNGYSAPYIDLNQDIEYSWNFSYDYA